MVVTDLCGKVIHRRFVADVGLVHRGLGAGGAHGIRGLVGRGEIAVDDHHLAGALTGQLHRGGPADAGARAGDQRELAAHLAPARCARPTRSARPRRRCSVDPLAGQPGDDVGTRRHHPVPAFDRDDPAADGIAPVNRCRAGVTKMSLRGTSTWTGTLVCGSCAPGDRHRRGHVRPVQVEPVDVVADRPRRRASVRLRVLDSADTFKCLNEFHPTAGSDRQLRHDRGTERNRCNPTPRAA